MSLLSIYDPLVKLLNLGFLEEINIGSIFIRLLLALICGGIIGVERAKKHMAAGFRTYILVCLGSAVAMLTNEFIAVKFGSDPSRIGAQVISGIGFLGAGTIIVTSRNRIKGLTTAAGLWGCACIGLAIGSGFYTLAIISCILIILIFSFLPKIESLFTRKTSYFEIHIEFPSRTYLKNFLEYARQNGLKIVSIEHNPAYSASGLSVYSITLYILNKHNRKHTFYIESFSKLEYVNYVEEI